MTERPTVESARLQMKSSENIGGILGSLLDVSKIKLDDIEDYTPEKNSERRLNYIRKMSQSVMRLTAVNSKVVETQRPITSYSDSPSKFPGIENSIRESNFRDVLDYEHDIDNLDEGDRLFALRSFMRVAPIFQNGKEAGKSISLYTHPNYRQAKRMIRQPFFTPAADGDSRTLEFKVAIPYTLTDTVALDEKIESIRLIVGNAGIDTNIATDRAYLHHASILRTAVRTPLHSVSETVNVSSEAVAERKAAHMKQRRTKQTITETPKLDLDEDIA